MSDCAQPLDPGLPESLIGDLLDGLDRLRVAIAILDADDRLTYHNSHLRYVYRGLAAQPSLIGRPLADIFRDLAATGEYAGIDPADIDSWVERQLRVLSDLSARPLEQRLSDGRVVQLKRRALAGGGFVVQWNDVTEARQGLIRLQDAVEGTADGFSLWDKSGQLISCSRAFAEAHALPGLPLAPGLRLPDFIGRMVKHGVYKPPASPAAWISDALDRIGAPRGEIPVPQQDGRWFLLLKRTTPDGAQVLSRVEISALKERERRMAAHTDELERAIEELDIAKTQMEAQAEGLAEMAEEIDQARAAAERANLAKTQFLRSITHELRTPLNAVIGFAEVIEGEMFGPVGAARYAQYAGAIRESGQHLMSLINNILDQARLESGRFTLSPAPLNLSPLVQFCRMLFMNRMDQAGLNFVIDIPPHLPPLLADDTALRQILVNLIGNAVKFTPRGGTVTLSAQPHERMIEISIRDTGCGIPQADLDRVLLPFEQVKRNDDSGHGGTGLGLPITKSLVELHGGVLGLSSIEGAGTTVTLTLPRVPDAT